MCAALNDRERAAARRAPDGHLAEAGLRHRRPGRADAAAGPLDVQPRVQRDRELHDLVRPPPAVRQREHAGLRRRLAPAVGRVRAVQPGLRRRAGRGGRAGREGDGAGLPPRPGPRQLRELRDDLRIAHFTHTPWAPPEQFAMLPDAVGRELLTGLLGADHVGFHSPRWARRVPALLRRVPRRRRGRDGPDRAVGGPDRAARACTRSGTAADELRERADQADVEARLAHLREQVGDRQGRSPGWTAPS